MDATGEFQRAVAAYTASQRQYADLQLRGSDASAVLTQGQLTDKRYQAALATGQLLQRSTATLVAEAGSTGVSGPEVATQQHHLAAKLRQSALLRGQLVQGSASLSEATAASDNALLRTNAESLRVGLLAAAAAAIAVAAVINMA
jgi:hypothetical protein